MKQNLATLAASGLTLAMLSACGGGDMVDTDSGTTDHLSCYDECRASETVSSQKLRASYHLFSDGKVVQGQAGFSTGGDTRYNVELGSQDTLTLKGPSGTSSFFIPASTSDNILTAIGYTYNQGAQPYVSKVKSVPKTEASFSFELTRGTQTFSAPITLPAPYTISAPKAGSTYAALGGTLPVRLTSTLLSVSFTGNFRCTDVNGGVTDASAVLAVTGMPVVDTQGALYQVNIPLITATSPDGQSPAPAITRCDLDLETGLIEQATLPSDLEKIFIQAVQLRQLKGVHLTLSE